GLGHDEHAAQVGVHGAVPFLQADLLQAAAFVDAGVVDKDVETAPQLVQPGDQLSHVRGVADVALDEVDFAKPLQLVDGFLERPVTPPADHHARALAQEDLRDFTADAGAPAGDQNPFALQLGTHVVLAVFPGSIFTIRRVDCESYCALCSTVTVVVMPPWAWKAPTSLR